MQAVWMISVKSRKEIFKTHSGICNSASIQDAVFWKWHDLCHMVKIISNSYTNTFFFFFDFFPPYYNTQRILHKV